MSEKISLDSSETTILFYCHNSCKIRYGRIQSQRWRWSE